MKRCILFFLIVIFITACQKEKIILIERDPSFLSLEKIEDDRFYFKSFDKKNQIEILVDNTTEDANAILIIESEGWNPKTNSFINNGSEMLEYKLVSKISLSTEYFTPVESLGEPDKFTPFLEQEITSWKASEITKMYPDIRSISKINKNEKAVSFFGYRLDDPEYPLKNETYLYLYESKANPMSEETKLQLLKIVNSYKQRLNTSNICWIGANGDMIFQRGVESLIRKENGVKSLFNETIKITKNVDLMIGNLEGPITFSTEKLPKTYNFKFHPQSIEALKEAGYKYLSINNNHSYDYGEKGFKDSLYYLDQAKMGTSGVGLTPKQAETPWITQIKGENLKVLSLGAYPQEQNGFNGEKQSSVTSERAGVLWANDFGLAAVKKAFEDKDSINIVMIHGGREWQEKPYPKQIDLYKELISLGADLVLGSHPHVLQGLEKYEDGLIAYSLGNFIFPGMQSMKNAEESIILATGFYQGRLLYIEPIGVKINGIKIDIDNTGKIIERLQGLTQDLY